MSPPAPRRRRGPLAAILATGAICHVAAAGAAELPPPASSWRSLEVPGYVVHHLAENAELAAAVAARLPGVRQRVTARVGSAPGDTVQVVITAPAGETPTDALPFHDGPRLVLSGLPPRAEELHGPFADWIAWELTVHHATLSHLLRRPEGRLARLSSFVLPVYPIALRAPPWVSLGYRWVAAGSSEGPLFAAAARLVAAGGWPERPRHLLGGEAIRHQLRASEVIGASFLAALERQEGAPALAAVWEEMADGHRSFATAVEAVYGEALVDLFAAHGRRLTAEAAAHGAGPALEPRELLAADSRLVAAARRGDDWVLERRDASGWRELLVRHGDGAPAARLPLPPQRHAAAPRWLADGSVVVSLATTGKEGMRRADLHRWVPGAGRLEALTAAADLSAPDAAGPGRVVAVRHRGGASALVRRDLATGVETQLLAVPLPELLDQPRHGPDDTVAVLHHDGASGWGVLLLAPDGGRRELPGRFPALAWPEWSPGGETLVAVAGWGDELGLARWELAGGAPVVATLPGLPLAAVPRAGGGADLLWQDHLGSWLARDQRLAFAPWPGEGEPPSPPALAPVDGEARPYRRGSTVYASTYGGTYAPSARVYAGGWRAGDPVGRWEVLAVAGISEHGEETGGLVSAAWRGGRAPLETWGYSIERRPSAQPLKVPGLGRRLDVVERGFALGTGWNRAGARRDLAAEAVLRAGQRELEAGTIETYALQLTGDGEWRDAPRGPLRLGGALRPRLAVGQTDGDEWTSYGIEGEAVVTLLETWEAGLGWRHDRVRDAPTDLERLAVGGIASSLLPASLEMTRIEEPALPVGALLGDRAERRELALSHRGWPFRIAWAGHRVAADGGGWQPWLEVVGLEIELDRAMRPLYRLPASGVRVGVARVLDEPFAGHRSVWASLAWSL